MEEASMGILGKLTRGRPTRTFLSARARLDVEVLESRVVLYAVSGSAWPHPELITISFVPDGTILGSNSGGYIYSDLFARFNARFGSTAAWQNQILRGAQVWAQQTNINFAVVADNGAQIGSGSYQQGDPGFGDIRIGGYNFGTSTLAQAFLPPPANNYSVAGDVQFNTGQSWSLTSNYHLFTMAMHEIGHALGLYHSSISLAAMYGTYVGVKNALHSDDIAGIRNIYSGNSSRSADAYDAVASNGSFSTATNLTSLIDPTALTALATGLDVTATSDLDYYTFIVPAGTTGTMTIKVQSSGLSLLAPTLTVYNASQSQIGFASGAGQYGTTLTVMVTGVSADQQFYVKVAGADTSAFGTGRYALTLNFGDGASPTVPLPDTQTPNGNPLQSGGGIPLGRGADSSHGSHHHHGDGDLAAHDDEHSAGPVGTTFAFLAAAAQPAPTTTPSPASVSGAPGVFGRVSPSAKPLAAPVVASPTVAPLLSALAGGQAAPAGADATLSDTEQDARPPADPTVDPPAPTPATPAEESGAAAEPWEQACDACFTDDQGLVSPGHPGATAPVAPDGDDGAGLDSAAAAAALALVAGGYWGARRNPAPWRKRSRSQV
jgi:hypothetical protein